MRIVYSVVLLLFLTSSVFAQATKNNSTSVNAHDSINRKLSVDEYEKKLTSIPDAQLIDVRTPAEYKEGHLKNARNIDVNSPQFTNEIAKLNKKRPVFLYCLSGGRSANAANKMAAMGFPEIYNMDGGIIKWLNAGKKITGSSGQGKGFTKKALDAMVGQKKYVLVDYNARWCEPCRKMLPYLESMAMKKKDKLLLITIDADNNKALLKEKGISGFPYLELYEDGHLKWKNEGYLDEGEFIKQTGLSK